MLNEKYWWSSSSHPIVFWRYFLELKLDKLYARTFCIVSLEPHVLHSFIGTEITKTISVIRFAGITGLFTGAANWDWPGHRRWIYRCTQFLESSQLGLMWTSPVYLQVQPTFGKQPTGTDLGIAGVFAGAVARPSQLQSVPELHCMVRHDILRMRVDNHRWDCKRWYTPFFE